LRLPGLSWWPAFTLGVQGVIFFEQHLALWATATSAFLVRLVIPDTERLRGREAVMAITVVGVVMLCPYGLGTQHPRLLTCEDFSISGNFAPEKGSSGTGTTVR
jgi:hypothetical protein